MDHQVEIYSDGACSGNPGPGGWAAILIHRAATRELSGHVRDTTNNRMELMGAIQALEALKRPTSVRFYTDSTYLKNGITTWLEGWKRNGWKTANRKPVRNQDLWTRLDQACTLHQIEWHWVKAHSDVAGNIRADQLARKASKAGTSSG
ncbi:MAG: ribonuclease HI [Pseudomonadota bacterium]